MRKISVRPRTVVDTNQFVSGTIIERGGPFLLLEAWRQGRFHLVGSLWQRREIEEALRKPKLQMRYGITRRSRERVLRRYGESAEMLEPMIPSPIAVRDRNDEQILALAITGRAHYLVTGDTDLLVLAQDPRLEDLQIVTVVRFLSVIDG